MLGSPILYLKGIRILMFQLSGFYYRLAQLFVLVLLERKAPVQGLGIETRPSITLNPKP